MSLLRSFWRFWAVANYKHYAPNGAARMTNRFSNPSGPAMKESLLISNLRSAALFTFSSCRHPGKATKDICLFGGLVL